MAEYRAIRVEKGSGGFGGPLTIQGNETKNKVMYITGGGVAPEILDKIYVCKQSLDLCPPIFDQYVAAEFLSSGRLDDNLVKSIELYKGKRDLLLGLLEEHMPDGVTWTHPEGGLFLFLTMPEGFEAVKFYDKALDAGVAYVAGEFFHPDGSGKNTMRMNFSFMSHEKMAEGVKLLAKLLNDDIL